MSEVLLLSAPSLQTPRAAALFGACVYGSGGQRASPATITHLRRPCSLLFRTRQSVNDSRSRARHMPRRRRCPCRRRERIVGSVRRVDGVAVGVVCCRRDGRWTVAGGDEGKGQCLRADGKRCLSSVSRPRGKEVKGQVPELERDLVGPRQIRRSGDGGSLKQSLFSSSSCGRWTSGRMRNGGEDVGRGMNAE